MITHEIGTVVECTTVKTAGFDLDNITIGKQYSVLNKEFDKIVILDDKGTRQEFYSFRFKKV